VIFYVLMKGAKFAREGDGFTTEFMGRKNEGKDFMLIPANALSYVITAHIKEGEWLRAEVWGKGKDWLDEKANSRWYTT